MYAPQPSPILPDVSSNSTLAIQSTLIPLPASHIPNSLARAEVLLKGKDKDNVRDVPFLDASSDSAFLPADVDPTIRHSHSGGDQSQDTSQYADPDLSHYDPRGRSDDRTRSSSGDQDRGQQGQWRQGGQIAGDSTYGVSGDPRQTGYRTGQIAGGPQEGFEISQNYGTSTGTGPGARPDDYNIHGDGGLGGKPTVPERVMGESVLSPLLVWDVV